MSYSEKVLERFENPKNAGKMDKNDPSVGTGIAGAVECGDLLKLQIKIENNKIIDAKFLQYGCGSAISSADLTCDLIKGKTIEEALQIKNTDIVTELSLPPVKIHCSVLSSDAVKAAIEDYLKKQDQK